MVRWGGVVSVVSRGGEMSRWCGEGGDGEVVTMRRLQGVVVSGLGFNVVRVSRWQSTW